MHNVNGSAARASEARRQERRGGLAIGIGLIACGMLMLAGGCTGGKMANIPDEASFQKVLIESKQPVLVEMFKGG